MMYDLLHLFSSINETNSPIALLAKVLAIGVFYGQKIITKPLVYINNVSKTTFVTKVINMICIIQITRRYLALLNAQYIPSLSRNPLIMRLF